MKSVHLLSHREELLKQKTFLDHYRKCGIIGESSEAAGVSRQDVTSWCKSSELFENQMLEAEYEHRDNQGALVLKYISEKAREGEPLCQKYVRKEHGIKEYKAVMRGKNLTWKGIEV